MTNSVTSVQVTQVITLDFLLHMSASLFFYLISLSLSDLFLVYFLSPYILLLDIQFSNKNSRSCLNWMKQHISKQTKTEFMRMYEVWERFPVNI